MKDEQSRCHCVGYCSGELDGESCPSMGVLEQAAEKNLCRKCGRAKVNRPQGLCWTCYYKLKEKSCV